MQVQVISKAGGSNKLIKEYIEAIQLKEESVVLIDVKIEDIEKIEYLDNKAIITLKNGEQIVIDNFNIEESSLVFRNENSELFLFDFETISYNPIDKIEPLLYGHSESSFISVWPIVGTVGVSGLMAAAIGGSSSSSSETNSVEDNTEGGNTDSGNTEGSNTDSPSEQVPPAAPTAYYDNVGDEQGNFPVDKPTDDSTPGIVIGELQEGETAELLVDGEVVEAEYDAETGTLTPKAPLENGEHDIQYVIVDAEGNKGKPSDAIQLVIDAAPAAPTAYYDNVGDEQGNFPVDKPTDDSTPGIVIGELQEGETAELLVDGEVVEAEYDAETGTLTPKAPLENGEHDIQYVIVDAEGNKGKPSDAIQLVIDAAPAAPTAYYDNVGDEQGNFPVDKPTDDSTPGIVIGELQEGETAELLVDGEVVEAEYDAETGTLTPKAPLENGEHDIQYVIVDAEGNKGKPSDAIQLVIDAAPAAPTAYYDNVGDEQGNFPVDKPTDDSTPGIVIGELQEGETAELLVDGEVVEAEYDAETGTLTPKAPLENGEHDIQYVIVDAEGNKGKPSDAIQLVIDAAPAAPTAYYDNVGDEQGNFPVDKPTDDSTPGIVIGELQEGETAELLVDGEVVEAEYDAETGTLTPKAPLENGEHDIQYVIVDAEGNKGKPSDAIQLVIDAAPAAPTAYYDNVGDEQGNFPVDKPTDDSTPGIVIGELQEGETAELLVDGEVVEAEYDAETGTLTPKAPLENGEHDIQYVIVDAEGNKGKPSDAIQLVIDAAPAAPTAYYDNVGDEQGNFPVDKPTDDSTPGIVIGELQEGETAELLVDGEVVEAEYDAETGTLTPKAPLENGEHDIQYVIVDAEGNKGKPSDAIQLVIDAAPAAPTAYYDNVGDEQGNFPVDKPTDDSTPGIVIGELQEGETAELLVDGEVVEAEYDAETGTLTPKAPLENGEHDIQYVIVDAEGNKGKPSDAIQLVIDAAPAAPTAYYDNVGDEQGNFPVDKPTDDSTPGIVIGELQEGETAELLVDGEVVEAEYDAETGTLTPKAPLENGEHDIQYVIVDAEGNKGKPSDAIQLVIDAAPAAPTAYYDNVGDEQGNFPVDKPTDDSTPGIVIGELQEGETAELLVDGEVVEAEYDAETGTLTPKAPLENGEHDIQYVIVDAEGNKGKPSDAIQLVIDAAPAAPTAYYDNVGDEQGNFPVDKPTDDSTPGIVIGELQEGETAELLVDGEVVEAEYDAETGTLTPKAPLENGEHDIQYVIVDAEGNKGKPSDAIQLVIDAAPAAPTAYYDNVGDEQGNFPVDKPTDDSTPGIVIGELQEGETAELLVDGEVVEAEYDAETGTLTPKAPLENGEHDIQYVIVDAEGNKGKPSDAIQLVIDAAPAAPTAYYDNVGDEQGNFPVDKPTDDSTPGIVIGELQEGETAELLVDGEVVEAEYDAETGTLTPKAPLENGEHDIQYVIVDAEGNKGKPSDAIQLVIDAAPAAPTAYYDNVGDEQGNFPVDKPTDDSTPGIVIGELQEGETAELLVDGEVVEAEYDAETGTLTPKAPLENGEHDIQYVIVDAEGNKGKPSDAIQLVIDAAPAAPTAYYDNVGDEQGNFPVDKPTDDSTPGIVIGELQEGETAELLVDGEVVEAEYDAETGTLTPKAPLENGEHDIQYVIVDAEGNKGKPSDAIQLVIDAAPAAPTAYYDNVGDEQGNFPVDKPTDDSTPGIVIGELQEGETAELLVDGEVVEAEYDAETGTLTPKAPLENGEHDIQYVIVDAEGNKGKPSDAIQLVIDAAPAAPTAYYDNVGDEQGNFPVDKPTDDSTPGIVIGELQEGETAELLVDGEVVEAEYDAETGTLTPKAPLENGEHDIQYVIVDAEGNKGKPSDAIQLVIDAAPAAPTAYYDNVGDEQGNFPVDKPTDDSTPGIVIGELQEGETAELLVDGEVVEAEYDAETGTLTPKAPLENGEHDIQYVIVDAEGNKGKPSDAIQLVIAVPPTLIHSEVNADGHIILSFDAELNHTQGPDAEQFTVRVNGEDVAVTGVEIQGTQVTLSTEPRIFAADQNVEVAYRDHGAADDANTLQSADQQGVNGTDVADFTQVIAPENNASVQSKPMLLAALDHVDENGIRIEEASAIDDGSLTNDSQPTFMGRGTPNDHIFLTIKDADGNIIASFETIVAENGIWELDLHVVKDVEGKAIELPETALHVELSSALDPDVQTVLNFTVDVTLATPEIVPPTDTHVDGDGITSENVFHVTNIDADATWYYSTNGGKTWHLGVKDSFTLSEGDYPENSIQVKVVDEAGNQQIVAEPKEWHIDLTPPAAPVIEIDGQAVTDQAVQTESGLIEIKDIPEHHTLQYHLGDDQWETLQPNEAGQYFIQLPTAKAADLIVYPADGQSPIEFKLIDQAGNEVVVSLPPVEIVDWTAEPVIIKALEYAQGDDFVAVPVGKYVSATEFKISGTAEAFSEVNLYFNGQSIGDKQITGEDGVWEFVFDSTDPTFASFLVDGRLDGQHSLTVQSKDKGNNVAESAPVGLNIDTFTPAPVIHAINNAKETEKDFIKSAEFVSGITVKGEAEAGSTVTVEWYQPVSSKGGLFDPVIVAGFMSPQQLVVTADSKGIFEILDQNNIVIGTASISASSEVAQIDLNRELAQGETLQVVFKNAKGNEQNRLSLSDDTKLTATTEADELGNWSVTFDPLPSSQVPLLPIDVNFTASAKDKLNNQSEPSVHEAQLQKTESATIFTIAGDNVMNKGEWADIIEAQSFVVQGARSNTTSSVDLAYIRVIQVDAQGNPIGSHLEFSPAITVKSVKKVDGSDTNWEVDVKDLLGQMSADGLYRFELYDNLAASTPQATLTVTFDRTPTDAPEFTTLIDSIDANGFTLDKPEEIKLAGKTSIVTNDTLPMFEGTVHEAGDQIQIALYNAVDHTPVYAEVKVKSDANGHWSYTFPEALPQGEYTVVIHEIDSSGNVSEANRLDVTIDTVAPEVIVDHVAGDDVDSIHLSQSDLNDGFEVTGRVEENTGKITLQIEGTEITVDAVISATPGADGWYTWTAHFAPEDVTALQDQATYPLVVNATDAAGNLTTTSVDITTQLGDVITLKEADYAGEAIVQHTHLAAADVELALPAQSFNVKGQPVTWSLEAKDHLVAKDASGALVLEVKANAQGLYDVVLAQGVDHQANNDLYSLVIPVVMGDQSKHFTIVIQDGQPTVNEVIVDALTQVGDAVEGHLVDSFGIDGGYLSSVSIAGNVYQYDATTNTVKQLGQSDQVYTYHYVPDQHVLTVSTIHGNQVTVNLETGVYRVESLGISQPAPAQQDPVAHLGDTGGLLGAANVSLLGLIDLSNSQAFTVSDANNDITKVEILSGALVNLDLGLMYSYSKEMAAEFGFKISRIPAVLLTPAKITITAKDGGVMDLQKLNEFLGTVSPVSGLGQVLDVKVLPTQTIRVTDSRGQTHYDNTLDLAEVGVVDGLGALLNLGEKGLLKEGTANKDTIEGGDNDERLYGYAGDDTLYGYAGSDILRGGLGNDTLYGGHGKDILIGGKGNDTLVGDQPPSKDEALIRFSDVFKWERGDQALAGEEIPVDVIEDFYAAAVSQGGDVLDLANLLVGEGRIGYSVGNLTNYLHFEAVLNADGDVEATRILISSDGAYAGGYANGHADKTDQIIVLEGIDLLHGKNSAGQWTTLSDVEIIEQLLVNGNLAVDSAEFTEAQLNHKPDLSISADVTDYDGDHVQTGESLVDVGNIVGQQATDHNTAPVTQVGVNSLLGLINLDALGLLNLSDQYLTAYDADNNLSRVEVKYQPIVDVSVTPMVLEASNAIAASLGMRLESVYSDGVLGLIAPSSTLVITAINGGTLDNYAVNEVLSTVYLTAQKGNLLTGDVLSLSVINSLSITAVDAAGASVSSNVAQLLGLNALNGESFNAMHEQVIVGTDGHDVALTGTEHSDRFYGLNGNDTIVVGQGNDFVRGGLGADTVQLEALDANTQLQASDVDVWLDFNLAEGDRIDVSDLLIGYDEENGSQKADFVRVDYDADNQLAIVSIDRDGAAAAVDGQVGHEMTAALILANQKQPIDLDDLLQNIIF
ncbi:Ig-like domain-containing protein [Acinetobacter thermotolerans]|uniref:Ig-like domain-containing protein n=1 Tax=Acinetobacter thermotolerans TaxID=3151487 RepID=UPI00325C1346